MPAFERSHDYLRHAEHCRRVAAKVTDPENRQVWLFLAQGWEELAAFRRSAKET